MNMMNTATGSFGQMTKVVALLAFVVGLLLFMRQAWRSYRLAKRMFAGTRYGSLRAAWWVARTAVTNPKYAYSQRHLFELVRKQVEFLIFFPRPQWHWPLKDDDELYEDFGQIDLRGLTLSEARRREREMRKAARAGYKLAVEEWREDFRTNRRKKLIELKLAGELTEALSEVKLYFDALKVLNPDPAAELEFLTPVGVKIGFIASQHLLTGLLIRFNEKWGDIIDGFERDTNEVDALIGGRARGDKNLVAAAHDFRQIQSFIYHCWLLWGPSIPVCLPECNAWKGVYTTLQFGYGDENNSIDIVGERAYLTAAVRKLLELPEDGGTVSPRFGAVMAVPASVRGVLQYSSVAELDTDRVPKALRDSWGGTQDERPILRLLEYKAAEEETRAGKGFEDYGEIGPEKIEEGVDPDRSRYYSAYFWIMFVVLVEKAGEWRPLHAADKSDRSAALWKAAIPFFEHGNMADAASCTFAKQQLAEKALSGMVNLVDAWKARTKRPFPLRFAYACAIDESDCGTDLATTALKGGETVASILRRRIAEEKKNKASRAGALGGIVDFDYYAPDPPLEKNPHAACLLSGDVRKHYGELDAHRHGSEDPARSAA